MFGGGKDDDRAALLLRARAATGGSMVKDLTQRQIEMRARQLKGRRGRKKRVSRREFLRRRIRSYFFLLEGKSPQWIATFFGVKVEAVQQWVKRGTPLVDAQPPQKKPELRQVPYYQ
jgi:hypothetical protein